jgi:MFS family permease
MLTESSIGLKQNLKQFSLLVLVNGFVGAMIGLERTIFPQFAEEYFGVIAYSAVLSFIVAFGFSKAAANYVTGKLANRFGRKNILVVGWLIAIPVPILLLIADSWNAVILANVLLGISQGFTWSSTVVMKIDLVGEKYRGFAMGLNEFAGYFAVGAMAFVTGWMATEFGVKPYPFYLGIAIAVVGLILSLGFVKDTHHFVKLEEQTNEQDAHENVFVQTSFKNKTLSAVTQAGLVNNLNDGMIWGLLPIVLLYFQFNLEQIGLVVAVYPAVWGIGQLFTGKMSDHFSKKKMLFWGMFLQGVAILVMAKSNNYVLLIGLSAVLGLGTALVYPTFLSVIAGATRPQQRAESVGVFRLWRDSGYAFGALLSGLVADAFGVTVAMLLIGLITIISAFVIQFRMPSEVS